ncbi:BPL-N domain-containing protein [Chlamydiifrater phoenicopteri]|uniref:BPL-N domain-containing protein n=1 Tax=Chlamydiifrater phoenicopteri TaxID=2681469 RepID=UPI001BCAD655|nr:BPL-N domain-containing protein [Chlamydiifrater phoenicopteri]
MKNILVYSGEGVSAYFLRHVVRYIKCCLPASFRGIPIIRVDEAYLNTHPFWEKETILLVVPGGADRPYHKGLSGRGTSRIAHFVREGGSFLGICAGAYFASARVYFEETDPEKNIIEEERDLKFFPGTAVGPIYGGGFSYRNFQGVRPSPLEVCSPLVDGGIFKATFSSLYHGGCYFAGAEMFPGILVEGRYSDVEGRPAAIISSRIEEGLVVLSGVHLEYQTTFCGIQDPLVCKAKEQLEVSGNLEALRAFSKNMFARLLHREMLAAF